MLGLFPYFILSQILFDFPAVRDFSSKKYNDTRIYVTNIYEAETTRITFMILHAHSYIFGNFWDIFQSLRACSLQQFDS
jgi:hypothetical protein